MSWSTDNLSPDQRDQIAAGCFTVQERRGNELHGLCPAHDDKSASFSYNTQKDAYYCLACGFKGDLVSLWGHAQGFADNKEAFKAFRERHGDSLPWTPSPGRGGQAKRAEGGAGPAPDDDKETKVIPESEWELLPDLSMSWRKRCRDKFGWSDAIIDRLGIRLKQIGPDQRIAIPIRDAEGRLVNVRLYLPGAGDNKIISWGSGYGKGKLFPAPPFPDEEPLILCEGEKDTICALSHGFNAVTQTTGVTSWSDKFTRFFHDRKVFIAYDNDDAGRKGAEKVAKKLADVAKSVWIIRWPAIMQDKQDVTDWFMAHGKTAEEFTDLLLDAVQIEGKEKPGRSRKERAEEIPEEQRQYFVGKQFKPRLVADQILKDTEVAYDAEASMLYKWDGRKWDCIHESIIRNRVLGMLGIEGNTSRVNDCVRIIQDLAIIKHGRSFNDKKQLIPLLNGVLDITTGKIQPHDSDNLNTYTLDITASEDYRPECPRWIEFLNQSVKDRATIRELQKFFGLCYTRETRYERAMYLIGPGGDGKGTIIKVLRSIVGEVNCSSVGMSDFMDQFHRIMMVDKLVNSTTEIRSELFQSDLLKTVISGEPVSVSQKHKPAFSTCLVAKQIFSGNSYPDIKDHTDGLYRRIMFIEMVEQFVTKGLADMYLFDKLMDERDGIFLWGLAGWLMLQKEGFTPSEAMRDNLELFKQKNNPVHSFILCRVEKADHEWFTPSQDLYDAYKKFCASRGHQPHSLTNTMLMLKQQCPWIVKKEKRIDGNKFLGYYGIALRSENV